MFKRKSKVRSFRAMPQRRLFHGVAIKAGDYQCPAAELVADDRFLAEEAPRLPLEDCADPAECHCRYVHFDDRRTDVRRETDIGIPAKLFLGDRRVGVGRRVTDG